ncbi:unnamed protein product [Prunus armeniaca]
MGARVGISVHGKFCVATENSIFAMPEIGARLDGAEILACGLATHFVPSAKLPLLEKVLISRAASVLKL